VVSWLLNSSKAPPPSYCPLLSLCTFDLPTPKGVLWACCVCDMDASLLFSVVESLWPITQSSIHVMINQYLVFWPVVCIDGEVRVCVGPWRGFKFQLVKGPQKLSFGALSSRRSSLTQIFVGSYVDFEVAHLSVLMVRRLPYPEIPTLSPNDMFRCHFEIMHYFSQNRNCPINSLVGLEETFGANTQNLVRCLAYPFH